MENKGEKIFITEGLFIFDFKISTISGNEINGLVIARCEDDAVKNVTSHFQMMFMDFIKIGVTMSSQQDVNRYIYPERIIGAGVHIKNIENYLKNNNLAGCY